MPESKWFTFIKLKLDCLDFTRAYLKLATGKNRSALQLHNNKKMYKYCA